MIDREEVLVAQELLELADLAALVGKDSTLIGKLVRLSRVCSDVLSKNGTIYFAGNGGSFADAQHMAAELTGKLSRPRRPLAGVCLGANSSHLTAVGNDYGFDFVFAREIQSVSNHSIVIAFSTSGTSRNIVELKAECDRRGLDFWLLTGSRVPDFADPSRTLTVPSTRTERIQEIHTNLGHVLCLLIEETQIFQNLK